MLQSREPIHSRGTGRSGPKRKTGCMTCRRRKVRCDETHPICANCVRLRLECHYVDARSRQSAPPSAFSSERGSSHAANTDSRVHLETPSTHAPTIPRPYPSTTGNASQHPHETDHNQQHDSQPRHRHEVTTHGDAAPPYASEQIWDFDAPSTASFPSPIRDIFFSSLDTLDADVDFANSDAFLGQCYYIPTEANETGEQRSPPTKLENDDAAAHSSDSRRRKLLHHFVQSANPISVVLPNHTEWKSTCRSVLISAKESPALLSAICAFSALHLHTAEGEPSVDDAYEYYLYSRERTAAILEDPNVNDHDLKQAFATIFILAHVELLAQTNSEAKRRDWPLHHLQNAHHRVHQHGERIKRWTGITKRLLTWLALLQAKAEYNCGHESLENTSASLEKAAGDPFARSPSAHRASGSPSAARSEAADELPGAENHEDNRTIAELAYDTINQPSFDFFLNSQAFTSKIIRLDRYHRRRGTLEVELETMKDGQQISADLHALWAARPSQIAFLTDPLGLEEALQPALAKRILLNLRVYVASFYAQFIYLHRVAFKTFPPTKDVERAIAEILQTCKHIVEERSRTLSCSSATGKSGMKEEKEEEAADARKSSSSSPPLRRPLATPNTQLSSNSALTPNAPEPQESSAAADTDPNTGLPACMLWPIFLAAIECSDAADRAWLLDTLKQMDNAHVPNAPRTVFLLEEVLRRQDAAGKRVDHRSVRQEVFESELSVLY